MFKTDFDRSRLVITVRLILLLIVLIPLGFGIYSLQHNLPLGNRTPALPTPPGALIGPRPTPHELVLGPIPLTGVKVLGMRFARENPSDSNDQWQFGTRFAKNEVHFINFVLDIEYAAAPQQYKFPLEFISYKEGENFASCKTDVIVDPPATAHGVACGYGWDQPGMYPTGHFYVEVLYEGEIIANGAFEIYEE